MTTNTSQLDAIRRLLKIGIISETGRQRILRTLSQMYLAIRDDTMYEISDERKKNQGWNMWTRDCNLDELYETVPYIITRVKDADLVRYQNFNAFKPTKEIRDLYQQVKSAKLKRRI